MRQLDEARRERNADYAVLVVPSEEKVPARMHALREYNGDKLIVAYDADEGPLALQVAYALARARVLMARGGAEGVDGAAVADIVERAVAELEEVRRIRQQLTGAKTQIDKASEIVGAMSDRVRGHLEEIAALVARGGGRRRGDVTVARRVVVHGRVQGVFFRETARRRARRAGVVGLGAQQRRRQRRGLVRGRARRRRGHAPLRRERAVGRLRRASVDVENVEPQELRGFEVR